VEKEGSGWVDARAFGAGCEATWDFNAEVAEVTEKREEKSGTKGSSVGDGCVGNAASMWNGSM
jgi:hypothetical protein